jgi:hypothetical protein
VVGTAFVPGNVDTATDGGRAAPTKTTIKGTKGGKKGQKCQPRRVAVVTGNSCDDKEAGNPGKDCIAAAKCYFMHQTQPPKDHFEKLLEATCLHHSYRVKDELVDCNMVKKIHDIRGLLQR